MANVDEFLAQYSPQPSAGVASQPKGSVDDFLSQYSPERKMGIADTARDNLLEGATFGLGNRAEAGLAAGVATGLGKLTNAFPETMGQQFKNDNSLSENYKKAREIESDRLKAGFEQNPVTSTASNLAGALATGGLGGETKIGAAVGDSLRGGKILGKDLGLAGKVVKGIGAGAATGAAFGAGTAGYDKTAEGAESGIITGALTGGTVPVAGAAIQDVANTGVNAVRGLLARSPEAVQDAAGALKSGAGKLYDQMRQVGATLNPNATTTLLGNIDKAVASKQFIPALNPKTLAVVDHIRDAVKSGDLGLGDLDQYRRLLGKIGATEDGVSAGAVRSAIDDSVNALQGHDLSNGSTQAVDMLNQGRKQYQQASKFEDIADILHKADGDPNRIKAGLTRFLNNEKNTRGWSPEELTALKDAASGSGTEKLLKLGGKFGIDLGTSLTMGNGIGPVIAGLAEGPIAPIAGTAARYGQKLTARGKAESLLKTLEGKKGASPIRINSEAYTAPVAGQTEQIQQNIQEPVPQQQIEQRTQVQPMNYTTQEPVSPQLPDVASFAKAESGGNPNAQSSTSSASGLYGFTNKTWADMVSRYGKETGINLKDKNNPQAQATMVKYLARDNLQSLQRTIGRMPSKGELYMAHVLGASGAAKLINADPSKEAIMLFPRQVLDANRPLFFQGNRPRTVAELQQLLSNKV